MAMKSAVTATETLISTVSGLMEESRQLKEVIESQKQNKDYAPEIKHKMPLSRSNNQLQVPKMMKMNNEAAKDSKLLQATSRQQPKLGISKSQDDEDLKEQQYGSVSPISFTKTSTTTSRTAISSLGASRAINFRMKFRKSHTCGSLFAKCNCGTNTTSTEMETTHLAGSRAASIDNTTTALAAATTITQATIHNQSLYYQQQQQQQQQQNLHLSMSPSSNTELSLASSVSDSAAKLTASSGFHSLSTQTSSATSAYLSREESLTASFDTQLISPTTETPPITTTTTIETTTTKLLAVTANTEQLAKSNVSQETELVTLTRSKAQQIPRISSPSQLEAYNAKSLAKPTPIPSPRRSEVLQKSSAKKLFQSYSHPDTDFIFTDENKHPSRESLSLLQTPLLQTQDTVITTRGGKVEIKQPKRSSSPNIGQYQVLDVAVHPDILVKISPKHSPQCEIRRTPLATRSTAQRRRLLQRSHEIDSGGSTTDSEKSLDLRTHGETQFLLGKPNPTSPLLSTKLLPGQSSPTSLSEDANFDAAQKYFAESGILGPIQQNQSNLIRKTSKALHDSNVIEQIRKTSMILRSQTLNTGNSNQATNVSSMRKNSSTSPGSSALTSPTKSGFTPLNAQNNSLALKLQTMTTTSPTSPGAAGTAQPALIYSPPSPQSPHTMATKCGFSPNVTTQSCMVVDDKDAQIKSLQGEIVSLKDVIKSRDAEIVKLRREIHKLKEHFDFNDFSGDLESVLQQTTNHIPLAHDELLQPPSPTICSNSSPNRFLMPLQCSDISSSQDKFCEKCKKLLENRFETIPEQRSSEARITPDSNGSSIDSSISDPYQSCHSRSASTGNTSESWAPGEKDDAQNAPKTDANESNGSVKPKVINASQHHPVLKKQGVSGESCEISMQQSINIPIPKYDKDYSSKQLIKEAIMDNDFLKNIDASQVRELVDSMYSLSIEKGKFVIREGEVGAHLYVSAEGEFEVEKNGKILGIMGPGKAFGELAILYNCTRTASIRVLSDARVWVLDRRIFQQIMMRTGMQRIENSVNFLKSVPLLKNLSEEVLAKIADVLEVEFYPAGTYIIRQGASGDTFFLISQGSVKVTQKLAPSTEEKEIRTLQMGDYFGEQALINEDKRTANIIAMAPGVECLTLDRESFTHLIGDLCELKEKNYGDENRVLAMKYSEKTKEIFGANVKQEFPDMKLTDLEVVATLGIGGFGRVELVKAYQKNRVDIFALKCLKKRHIVDTKQEEHVFSERTIMLTCNSPFICRLYRTFRDEKYVYMLLEACMGGEIWTMLRDRGSFDDNAAQFIIGCVLQAFEYLHAQGIIYRDLKPENLMLDERGYVKLVDFGFAKYIGNSSKTWTFCGTPEYVAPEIILNKGHDRAVDYWALGILIHELLNGTPPFTANDPMKTYNIILKGIDMIDFPKHMSRSAVQLIKKLCRDVPAERLGYQKGGIQDIKKHKWFLGFDWDGLQSQLLIPPFVRPIAHPTDTCYFDRFPCDPNEPPDELSGWDAGF
ncbi:cGMP-dependent protein kinase, isozyme 1 isoform X1 [Lucilia sericata]|uniref:cGMP-dependent protein kinase, isozyme 1 isoform X1 n=1 Tax=Lucilia sericata TaxID=13632 RepID=UPI0018A7F8FA|nr:cGMP-dependent protein kinase, isozyme 1 isoform X1 [Lucilia sericata]